jgi:hypothetical protein
MKLLCKVGRRGMFFSIDAFLAVALALFVMSLMAVFYVSVKSSPHTTYYSSDIAQILSNVQLAELTGPGFNDIVGNISDQNRTVLEQALRFQVTGDEERATQLINLTIGGIVPNLYEVGVWVEGYTNALYATAVPGTVQLVSTKKLISGIEKDKVTEGIAARALLTNIGELSNAAFAYFGGYEGDGNITKLIILPPSVESIDEMYLEVNAPGPFDLFVNGNLFGSFVPNTTGATWWTFNSSLSDFTAGTNTVVFSFSGALQFIGGGYMKVQYTTDELSSEPAGTKRIYFPGVEGIINIFSSFYVPGNVMNLSAQIHYISELDTFMTIGNRTIFSSNATGEQTIVVNDGDMRQLLNYGLLGDRTIPVRLGVQNVSLSYYGFGGSADSVLVTDVSGSMGQQSKLAVAKEADKEFVNVVLAVPGNKVGLVSYSSTTKSTHDMSNDTVSLYAEIDTYKSGGNTCICCGVLNATYILQTQTSSGGRSMLVMSDGKPNKDCGMDPVSDHDGDGDTTNDAEDHAIQAACDAYQIHNITVYTVGFGNLNQGAIDTLAAMSECGNGEFVETGNENVTEIYQGIAQTIVDLNYESQQLVSSGGSLNSTLFTDSYIDIVYTPTAAEQFGLIPVTIETARFGNNVSIGNFSVPSSVTVTEARVTSYSGDKWTDKASINTGSGFVDFFDLSDYGADYVNLGDPYSVHIPAALIGENNEVLISTGTTPVNSTGGSVDNRILYTAGISLAVNYTGVFEFATGCIWDVSFEDGSNATLTLPSSYTGGQNCTFTDTTDCAADYATDGVNNAVCQLFSQLDIDDDGDLFVKFGDGDIDVDTTTIETVPFMWGPSVVEVRVWR